MPISLNKNLRIIFRPPLPQKNTSPNSCLLLSTRPTKIGNVCYLNPGLAPPFSLATTAPSPVFRVWKSKDFGNLAHSPVLQRGAARENNRPCRHLRNFGAIRLGGKVRDFPIASDALGGGDGWFGSDCTRLYPWLVILPLLSPSVHARRHQ